MQLIVSGVCTLLLGLLLTPITRRIARHFGIIATPRKDRWHHKPTAMLGGIAIYAAFMTGFFIFVPNMLSVYPIIAAATLLFVTGLIDDFIHMKPYVKLIIQTIAAAATVYCGLQLPWTNYQAVNEFITIFWLVSIPNAVNLLDNMDGLAGGVALIACVFLVITFLLNGQAAEAVLLSLLGGAVLGFLVFNFQPASIFMGDCGSMFLGFMLGGTALLSDYGRSRNLASVLLTPVLILLIPIFDSSLVMVTRKLSGLPVSHGGRDHISHRLVALGMSERRAVMILYSFAAFSGMLALLVRFLDVEEMLLVIPGFALLTLFVGLSLGEVRIYEGEQPQPGNTIINALLNFSYKRRVFEVLLDLVLVALAYYGAYLFRYDGALPYQQLAILTQTLPVIIVIQMSCFLLFGVYRGLWRYLGIDDMIVIGKSVLASAVASSALMFFLYGLYGPSRAVLVLYPLLLLFFVGTSRLSFRLLRALLVSDTKMSPDAKPILIYGADDDAALLIRELLNNPEHGYVPIGFIDDDERKAGKLMYGYRVFGNRELPMLIRTYGISEVLISNLELPETKLNALASIGVHPRRVSIHIE